MKGRALRTAALFATVPLLAVACSDDGGTTTAEPDATEASESTTATTESAETTAAAAAMPEDDRIIGTVDLGLDGTGRWRVEEVDGVWWFVAPDGRALFSMGSNGVKVNGTGAANGEKRYLEMVMAKYGTEDAWADATKSQLDELGFNTAGAWSTYELVQDRMPYTPIIAFKDNAPEIDTPPLDETPLGDFSRELRDYFYPAFEQGAPETAEKARECVEHELCIGVFTDNELEWGPSPTQATTYLDAYLHLPAGAPGKVAVQEFFADRYEGDIEAFNATWELDLESFDEIQEVDTFRSDLTPGQAGGDVSIEELTTGEPDDILALVVVTDPVLGRATPEQRADRKAFRDHVAEHYYSTVAEALDEVDPELLNLGTRNVSIFTDPSVLELESQYVDVLSINSYEFSDGVHALIDANWPDEGYLFAGDPHADLDTVYQLTGLPIMLTEWSYRARVPDGPPSDFPPSYPTYDTQAERAEGYVRYMDEVLARPQVVGSHWFIYADQPASGRGDGENNNFGIVDIDDNLWEELAAAMQELNVAIPESRAALAGS